MVQSEIISWCGEIEVSTDTTIDKKDQTNSRE